MKLIQTPIPVVLLEVLLPHMALQLLLNQQQPADVDGHPAYLRQALVFVITLVKVPV